MNIHQALSDIAEIRAQLDRTEIWKGFRSTAVGISVLVVIAGAWLQTVFVTQPAMQIDRYLTIWFVVAIASILIAALEMLIRSRVSCNRLVDKMHWSLAAQMMPSLVVGFVVTLLISEHAFEQKSSDRVLLWMLPGLWSMIYSLGLFACRSHLPRRSNLVAGYLLLSGIGLTLFNWKTGVPHGWQMVVSFGAGQLMLAGILYWNLERRLGEKK